MPSLSSRILDHALLLPEAAPICPVALLHLGSRAAVDQALSRLVHSEQLMRVCRGVYMRPIETRFGLRAPAVENAIDSLSALWGNHRPMRRSGRQLARAHAADSGAAGVSDLRPRSPAVLLPTARPATPCPALATGGTAPPRRRSHSRPGLARPGRSRGRADPSGLQSLERRPGRAGGCSRNHAGMDGYGGECVDHECLIRHSSLFRQAIDATHWQSPNGRARGERISWKRTSGSCRSCTLYSARPLAGTWCSRAGPRWRRPTERSAGSRRMSTSPETSVRSRRIS